MTKITELQIEKWEHEGDVTCLVEHIRELEAENERLNSIIDHRAEDLELQAKYKRLEAENEKLKKENKP